MCLCTQIVQKHMQQENVTFNTWWYGMEWNKMDLFDVKHIFKSKTVASGFIWDSWVAQCG